MTSTITITSPLNTNIQALCPSATLLINERSKELIAKGRKIYRLGFGQSPFPIPSEVVEALQKNAAEKDYLPVQGLPILREAVAQFNHRTLNLNCSAGDIMIGPGSKELIFSLQLAFDGDLLLPSPSWVSYEPQACIVQKKTHWISTNEAEGWRLSPENLEAACLLNHRPKVLILNYPNNPVGTTYNATQLQELAHVARKYNLLVVADEIYGEVEYHGQHKSLAQFYPEGTIISGGLSKWAGAGGWRLGTFTFPKNYQWLQNAMTTIASETFSAVSAPIQYAAVTAFKGSSSIDQYLQNSRRILKTIGHYVFKALIDSKLTLPAPEGGFYLFPNFEYYRYQLLQKGIRTSTQLCEQLLEETGIALLPGVAFGRPKTELTARLSYVDFDGKKTLDFLSQTNKIHLDAAFVEAYCPNIQASMQVLKNWLPQ